MYLAIRKCADNFMMIFRTARLGKMPLNIELKLWMSKTVALVSILHSLHALKIDMSNQKLTAVPQTIKPTVDHLILSHNTFTTLDTSSFQRYANLLELNLNNCEIQFIYNGTFLMQVKLMKLFIKYNQIKYLPLDFGPSVNTLVDFRLYGGLSISYQFKHPYFSAFKQLRIVNMGRGIFDLSGVTLPASIILFRAINAALKIFPNFSNAVSLETISLSQNDLSFIPDELIKTVKGPVTSLDRRKKSFTENACCIAFGKS